MINQIATASCYQVPDGFCHLVVGRPSVSRQKTYEQKRRAIQQIDLYSLAVDKQTQVMMSK